MAVACAGVLPEKEKATRGQIDVWRKTRNRQRETRERKKERLEKRKRSIRLN